MATTEQISEIVNKLKKFEMKQAVMKNLLNHAVRSVTAS